MSPARFSGDTCRSSSASWNGYPYFGYAAAASHGSVDR